MNLKWADVDLTGRTISIKKAKSRKQRILVISERLTSVLRALKCLEYSEYVFVNRDGKPYRDFRSAHRHTMMRSGLADKREAAGQQPLRFHDLGHTCATILAEQSKNLSLVATQLGHSSLEMTRRYAHLTRDHHRDQIETMSKRLNEVSRHTHVIVGNFGQPPREDSAEKTASEVEVLHKRP